MIVGSLGAAALMALVMAPPDPASAEPGPRVGERLPAFEARDQDGRPRTFESLRGPEGLALLFFRSADW